MNHQETIWIKKEETDVDPNDPGLVFLEDTLKMEIKTEPDLKLCGDSSETNVTNFLEDTLKMEIKTEPDLDRSETNVTNFVQDPLEISWPTHFIKEDPGLSLEADETASIVVDSTKCASNTTRLIQNGGKSCGNSFEETVTQEHAANELDMYAIESAHQSMLEEEEQEEFKGQEENLFADRVKCSWRQNSHTFTCNFCLQNFASKYKLIKHVFFHMEGVQPPAYICKYCGEVFSCDIGLSKHLKMNEEDSSSHHNHKTDCIYKHENISLERYETFSVREQTEKQYSYQLKSQAVKAPVTRSHKCDVCGKYFSQLRNLKCHILLHTGTRPYKCDVCGKGFTIVQNLKNHLLIHTGLKPHKCDVCGKSFTYVGNLNKHAVIHTGLRPHKCDTCGKAFKQMLTLKRHLLIHTGIKPHKCDICGNSFREIGTLRSHAMTHTGIKPHTCDVCGKCFTYLKDLKTHSVIHTKISHKCDVCGKSFNKLCNLKNHAVKHHESKPYKCDACGKSFTTMPNLKDHERRHSGIRRRKCDVCGKTFIELEHLKIHAAIHTGTQMLP